MDINQTVVDIGEWRRSKEFFTPDARAFQETAPAVLTNADAMLGKLMHVVCEIAEAAEECRTGDYEKFSVEMADAVIRIFDICDASGINISRRIMDKMDINRKRPIRHGKITVL